MQTLEGFKQLIVNLNTSLRFSPGDTDMCRKPLPLPSMGPQTFVYEFGGLIDCVVEFFPDGSIREAADVAIDKPIEAHEWRYYLDFTSYVDRLIEELDYRL